MEVEKQIHDSSWLKVTETLDTIWRNAKPAHVYAWGVRDHGPNLKEFSESRIDGSAYNLPQGIIRDALIKLLDLEAITGIDVDLLESFADIEGPNLQSIREEVCRRSLEILSSQVKRGDTFLLDIDEMISSPYNGLVKEIVERRTAEILSIGRQPHIKEIVSTYYGFTIVVEGTLETDKIGIRNDTKSAFMDCVKALGGEITEVRGKRMSYSPSLFPKCSNSKADLLAGILSLAVSGNGNRYLFNSGDSRSLDLLIRHLTSPAARANRSGIIRALASTGDPKALEVIRNFADAKHEIAVGGIVALGHIRSPKIVSHLIDKSKELLNSGKQLSYHQENKAQAFLIALGKTENPSALPILENALLHNNEEIRFGAITGLVVYGEGGDEVLKNQIYSILELMCTTKSLSIDIIFDAIVRIPAIMIHTLQDDPKAMNIIEEYLKTNSRNRDRLKYLYRTYVPEKLLSKRLRKLCK